MEGKILFFLFRKTKLQNFKKEKIIIIVCHVETVNAFIPCLKEEEEKETWKKRKRSLVGIPLPYILTHYY